MTKIIARNTKDRTTIEYKYADGKIRGSFFHANGLPMSDGNFTIEFSWNLGNVSDDNWKEIVAENIADRWNVEIA